MSDHIDMTDRSDDKAKPTDPSHNSQVEIDLVETETDFKYTVRPKASGGPRVHNVSDPASGHSKISWADLLRQRQRQSDAEMAMGSLPEIQIDAVPDLLFANDNDSGERLNLRPESMPPPASASARNRSIIDPPMPAAVPKTQTTPDSLAARLFAHEDRRKDDWIVETPNNDPNNQSSSVNLMTAARVSDAALKGDSSNDKCGDSDILSHALLADDASSSVNLGMEPRASAAFSNIIKPKMQLAAPVAAPGPQRKAPSRPTIKMPSTLSYWIGGAALGVAATGLGAFVWYGGKLPSRKPAVIAIQAPSSHFVVEKSAATPAEARKQLEAGDPVAALAILKDCPESPEVLLSRGQARWLEYLREQKQRKAALTERDADVETARNDLGRSQLPEGMLWIGLMNESLGHFDIARDTYRNGFVRFPDKAKLFQAAAARLDAMTGGKAKTATVQIDPQIGFALTLILMESAGTEPEEAGFDYWEAVKLAKIRDFSAAHAALVRARAAHDERRQTLLRQGLNPNSDPREEIFLHNCDQLIAYWDVQAKLQSSGVAFDPDNPTAAIETLVQTQKKLEQSFQTVAVRLGVEKPDDVTGALDTVISKRKKAEDDFQQAEKQLRMATANLGEANASLDAFKTEATEQAKRSLAKLQEATARETEARKALADFAAARKDADEILHVLTGKLQAAKLIGDNPKPTDFVSAFDAMLKPKAGNPTLEIAAFKSEIERLKRVLGQSRSSAQMLDLWPVMLESRTAPEIAASALADADAVAGDSKADAKAKAKAMAVKGLALVAQGQYSQARAIFASVRKGNELATDAAWSERVRKAGMELNDSSLTTAQVRRSIDRDEPLTAMAEAERGLKIFSKDEFPKDHARVLAMRGEVWVKLNRLSDAERDANAAVEGGASALGFYTAGRVAEKRGKWDVAKEAYRRAYGADPQAAEMKPIRVAFARVLARPDADSRDLVQAEQLADEAIQAGQAEGHLVKARILYRKNKHTEALQHALAGLSGVAPAEFADGWELLVKNHPALSGQTKTIANKADPAMAERYFADGLRLYYAHEYAQAETEFASAIKNHDRDARFHYFMGLSRLPLGKVEAAQDDFRQAAALEREGLPDSPTISMYFERIQGEERQMINKFRR